MKAIKTLKSQNGYDKEGQMDKHLLTIMLFLLLYLP